MLNKKYIILVSIIMAISILLPIGNVQATLQSNPNTHIKKGDLLPNWITNTRNMEKSGGALGLSETLKDDLTAEGENNNIDMHMMRSTEYGAIAILSASGYGNQQTLQESEIKTTTGNETGIYFTGTDWEYVAGGMEGYIPSGLNSKYFDSYGDSNSAKAGDALGTAITTNLGCAGWHSASNRDWCDVAPYRMPFFRRGNRGLFSYNCYEPNDWSHSWLNHYSHGVAVCGQGI